MDEKLKGPVTGYWQGDVFWDKIQITCTGVGSYQMPLKDTLQRGRIIGLAMRTPGSGKLADNGSALINSDAFNCGFIAIRRETSSNVIEYLPMEMFALRSGGDNYFLRTNYQNVDMPNSRIIFSDKTQEVAGEMIELLVAYVPFQYC